MNNDLNGSGRVDLRLGFAAAVTLGALFVLYIFCFAGILLSGPLFTWKGLDAFLDYTKNYDQTLKYISYAGMLLFCYA